MESKMGMGDYTFVAHYTNGPMHERLKKTDKFSVFSELYLFFVTRKGFFMKILIVEDEPALRELIQRSLEKERYITELAPDFDTALEKIELYDYDCILLDIMLPGGSGLELLARLKELNKKENVIIISAKDSLEDKVLGLELGADDYLPKPFHLAELTARVKSVLRRKHRDGGHVVQVGNVRLFPDTFQVQVEEKQLELSRKEYDILHYLQLYLFLLRSCSKKLTAND